MDFRWFKREKKQPALPAPKGAGNLSAEFIARAQFRAARFGHVCRTADFIHPTDSPENVTWWEAQFISAAEGWQIQEFHQQRNFVKPELPVDTLLADNVVKHKNLLFFEAVQKLAEISNLHEGMEYKVTGNTRETLGLRHYRDFAEREGILFDVHGMPQATLHGAPVSPGTYTREALEKARLAAPPYQPESMDVLESLMAEVADAPAGLKEIVEAQFNAALNTMGCHIHLEKLAATCQSVVGLMVCAFEKEIWIDTAKNILTTTGHVLEDPALYPSTYGYSVIDKTAAKTLYSILVSQKSSSDYAGREIDTIRAFESLQKEAQKILDDYPRGVDVTPHKQMLVCAELVFQLLQAKYLMNRVKNGIDQDAKVLARVKEKILQAEKIFVRLGGREDTAWKIKASLLEDASLKVPEPLKAWVRALNEECQNFRTSPLAAVSPALKAPRQRPLPPPNRTLG